MGKIRVRLGENEIELDGSDDFIKKHLEQFYSRVSAGASSSHKPPLRAQLLAPSAPNAKPSKEPTAAEFYKQKGSKGDRTSIILIFGKYLEQYRNKPEFSQGEINSVAKDAKLPKNIHGQYFTNAVKQGLLRKQGKRYSLTLSAEELLADS